MEDDTELKHAPIVNANASGESDSGSGSYDDEDDSDEYEYEEEDESWRRLYKSSMLVIYKSPMK